MNIKNCGLNTLDPCMKEEILFDKRGLDLRRKIFKFKKKKSF